MGATLNNKPSLVRLGAFAAVLLLTAGLLVTLFQEASAANIVVDGLDDPLSGSSHEFFVDIVVPQNQHLPLVGVSAVIEERPNADATSKNSASDVGSVVSYDTCSSPISGCLNGNNINANEDTTVLTDVRFAGAFAASDGYLGYDAADILGQLDNGYFSNDEVDFEHTGGYGYHPSLGYGYGVNLGDVNPGGNADGYGYDNADLILRFTFTIDLSELDRGGTYWFTALGEVNSAFGNNPLSSAATPFSVRSSTSAGPSSGSGSGGGSDGPTSTVDAGELSASDVPEGALEGWRASVTGDTGDKIRITTGSDRVPRVDFTLSGDADGADVDVTVFPSDSPPEGTPAATWRGAFIVQITISTGSDHTVEIFVEFDADDMQEGDENNAFGAKHVNPWVPQSKVDLTLDENTSKYTGSFSANCCSVFMVGFDEEDPMVTLSSDGTSVEKGDRVTFTADVDDDVQVDRVEFYLGDQLVHTADSEPYTWEWTTADASVATHNVRAVAYDLVGNEAEDSQSVEVQQADDGGGPTGGDDDEPGFPWWLIILIAIVVIGGAIWYASSQKKQK